MLKVKLNSNDTLSIRWQHFIPSSIEYKINWELKRRIKDNPADSEIINRVRKFLPGFLKLIDINIAKPMRKKRAFYGTVCTCYINDVLIQVEEKPLTGIAKLS